MTHLHLVVELGMHSTSPPLTLIPLWHGVELRIRSSLPDFIRNKLAHRAVNGSSTTVEYQYNEILGTSEINLL